MATRLRLQRFGAKGAPYYKIVVADSRTKRDGKTIDLLGSYNPTTIPATITLDVDKTVKWLMTGAEPSDTVKAILSYKGAMYKKHLLRGVKLGVVKEEDVETKFNEWVANKEGKVTEHKEKAKATKKAKIEASVNTPAKVKVVPVEEVIEEVAEVSEEVISEAVVETVAEETPVAQETALAEAPVAPSEETPEATEEKTETAEL